MKFVRISRVFLTTIMAGVVCLLFVVPCVQGQAITVQIDENGNGLYNGATMSWSMAPDPGPGGLSSALTYLLPAGVPFAVGDLLIDEPGTNAPSDLIRWNGNGTVVFYSDIEAGESNPDLADVGLPTAYNPLVVTVTETGLFGHPYTEAGPNGYVWTPAVQEPGYTPGGITYTIISDIPEPGTVALVGLGLVGLLAIIRRRR